MLPVAKREQKAKVSCLLYTAITSSSSSTFKRRQRFLPPIRIPSSSSSFFSSIRATYADSEQKSACRDNDSDSLADWLTDFRLGRERARERQQSGKDATILDDAASSLLMVPTAAADARGVHTHSLVVRGGPFFCCCCCWFSSVNGRQRPQLIQQQQLRVASLPSLLFSSVGGRWRRRRRWLVGRRQLSSLRRTLEWAAAFSGGRQSLANEHTLTHTLTTTGQKWPIDSHQPKQHQQMTHDFGTR